MSRRPFTKKGRTRHTHSYKEQHEQEWQDSLYWHNRPPRTLEEHYHEEVQQRLARWKDQRIARRKENYQRKLHGLPPLPALTLIEQLQEWESLDERMEKEFSSSIFPS